MLSPPFLAYFVWRKFLASHDTRGTVKWKILLDWIAVLSVPALFVVCVVAFFTIPSDVARYGWRCVAKWRSFSAGILRSAPLFLILAARGRKGTRILSLVWVITINFDCIMVDMMA